MQEKQSKINEHRLTSVEITQNIMCKDVDGLKKDVKLILENHLPHLKSDISSLNKLVRTVGTGIILSIVANIIINLMMK